VSWLFSDSTGNEAMTSLGATTVEGFDIADAAAEARDAFQDNLSEFIHDGWRGDVVRIQQGTAVPSEPITFDLAPWDGGTAAVPGCTPQVSYLLKKITARGGRKGRGRMYLPGPPEDAVDAYGLLSESQFDALTTAVVDFAAQMLAATNFGKLVLLHTDPLEEPDDFTNFFPETKVATQRRRLDR
jgi:hypothetical protein